MSAAFGSPIPLSEIEGVLAWVDTFKLSRPTKKINRDFSDAVLLAEILGVHYPKLVEMHNYPPRNSHALKLNNWMTLNRKVLKKLKITLCTNTMEQLSNCTPGVIERVLVMVRDKIKRDEELEKSTRDAEANMSSGGSYYEACGDDEGVLIVPVKTRVNGVLETLQQKVVSYEVFTSLKEELKDAKDTTDLLKQKVDHLDSLIKLKDERITELQKQIDRKQIRRKEAEILQNSISAPFEDPPSPTLETAASAPTNKLLGPLSSGPLISGPLSSGPLSSGPLSSGHLSSGHLSSGHLSSGPLSSGPLSSGPLSSGPPSSGPPSSGPPSSGPPSSGPLSSGPLSSGPLISGPLSSGPLSSGPPSSGPPSSGPLRIPSKLKTEDMTEVKLPTPKISFTKIPAPVVIKPSVTELPPTDAIEESKIDVDRIKSDIFKEANVYEDKVEDKLPEAEEEFKDSEPGNVTILEDIDTVKEPYDKKY